jgi:hypothetical protein
LLLGGLIWALMAAWILERLGSALPRVAMQRFGIG